MRERCGPDAVNGSRAENRPTGSRDPAWVSVLGAAPEGNGHGDCPTGTVSTIDSTISKRHASPIRRRPPIPRVLALLLGVVLSAAAVTVPRAETSDGSGTLLIEDIVIEGAVKTTRETVLHNLVVRPGDAIAPDALFHLADPLVDRGIFVRASVHTRPGSAPGRIVAVIDAEERGPQLRFGLGYEDLTGWYLIPAELDFDNASGHGETLRAGVRFGYRVGGVVLEAGRAAGPRGGLFWRARATAETVDRVYFYQDTEIAHPVRRGGLELRLGSELRGGTSLFGWVAEQSAEADSSARIYQKNEEEGRKAGTEVPFEDLPPGVARDLERQHLTRFGVGARLDRRQGPELLQHGVAGTVELEGIAFPDGAFGRGLLDLRGYLPLGRGAAIAARTQLAGVGPRAPFYERLYLGGLYSVRGFPSQSLSRPQGETHLASGSIELRAPWVGPAARPTLAGLVFVDTGVSWSDDLAAQRLSVGAGYGVRIRLPWVRYLGVDVGFPLTASPAQEAFHVNASLGWTY
ncbi:MAG: BamA/TamA family outer membrane protein [Candidatus Eisenbacteria bacterium]|uniref:BamA/TamA family outer membrane protein n=1 Tax=Eiseniibacteriota bacterium TaxID=2212470 RepID=A0A956M210_UNCEI|nr:BamA/TamA family outer membrane protein [Candidatus Eisenbacteria bacterium]